MGADNYSWNLVGRGEAEDVARMRVEHARFKVALEAIASTACGPLCGCCGMDAETARDALAGPRQGKAP